MAHFAKINNDNIVEQVIAVDNTNCCGGNFPDSEICGQNFIQSLGLDGVWKQTSYNGNFRQTYAGIGYTYNETLDIFISPKPFDSWIFDNNTKDWTAPVSYPEDNQPYYWDENNQQWILMEIPDGV